MNIEAAHGVKMVQGQYPKPYVLSVTDPAKGPAAIEP